MKRVLICTVVVLAVVMPAEARTVELTLYPAKIAESPQKYRLLPSAGKQIDADALPLYKKAMQSMPQGFGQKQMQDWLALPIEQFPQKKADAEVQKHVESLRLLVRAARCKECNWPEAKQGKMPDNLTEYRKFAVILALWARLETSRGQYKGALAAMQTGFGMARQIGQGPMIIQAMVGSAIGGLMCKEVEQFMQRKDSPNLYRALANLPRPLVDMERTMENELANLKIYDSPARKEVEKQLKGAQDNIRMIERKADTRFNALQCLEAIRDYAAAHDGQLPETLSDINNLDVPKDVMGDRPFEYRRTTTGAVLQSVVERDAIRYEIVVKK